jgi:hypothetical protein
MACLMNELADTLNVSRLSSAYLARHQCDDETVIVALNGPSDGVGMTKSGDMREDVDCLLIGLIAGN